MDTEYLNYTGSTTPITITDDPISLRLILDEIVKQLRGPSGRAASRERSIAVTKLQEARFWLGEDMFVNATK